MNGKVRFSTLEDAKQEPLSTLKAPEEKGTSLNIFLSKGKPPKGKTKCLKFIFIFISLFIFFCLV